MYAGEDALYCYPGTAVLRNRLGLTDPDLLQAFETEATSFRAEQGLPRGRFGVRHYYAVHRHLFQDVYAWAGRPRRIRTGKDGVWFCYPEHIPAQLAATFGSLKARRFLRGLPAADFARAGAAFLAELNAIHAFREGNGRTQTLFFAMLAEAAGHPLDLRRLQPDAMLDAMIRSFAGNEGPLREVLEGLLA